MTRDLLICTVRFVAVVFSMLFIEGCVLFGGGSGEIEPQKATGFTVKTPAGWKKKVQDESDQAYRLESGSLVTLNSSCHRHFDAPLEVLTRQLLIGSRNIEVEHQDSLSADGAEGLYTNVRATLDGVPFYLDLFVLKRESCIFDFSLVNPKNFTTKDREEFRSFIKSFHYGAGKN
jgi:hypothetical protein